MRSPFYWTVWVLELPCVKPILWMIGGSVMTLLVSNQFGGDELNVEPEKAAFVANPECQPEPLSFLARGRLRLSSTFLLAGLLIPGGLLSYEVITRFATAIQDYEKRRLSRAWKRLAAEREELNRWRDSEQARLQLEESRIADQFQQCVADEIARRRAECLLAVEQERTAAEAANKAVQIELAAAKKLKTSFDGLEKREAQLDRREQQAAETDRRLTRRRANLAQVMAANELLVRRIDAGCEFLGDALAEYLLEEPPVLNRLLSHPVLQVVFADAVPGK